MPAFDPFRSFRSGQRVPCRLIVARRGGRKIPLVLKRSVNIVELFYGDARIYPHGPVSSKDEVIGTVSNTPISEANLEGPGIVLTHPSS